MSVQTILGAGGVIGRGLARELPAYGARVRLASRHPAAVNPDDECAPTDLLDLAQVARAVAGSRVAYLVAGLAYDARVWEAQWPRVLGNAIAACARHACRLVFFDNVYCYGRVDGPMTEATPMRPVSRKGEVRARLAERLLDAAACGEVDALIARSADFYGPDATHTFVHPMVFAKLLRGERAVWLCNDAVPHSMTYTPDAARATALLGNGANVSGQVWHLPTAADPPDGRAFVAAVAAACGVAPRHYVLKPWLLRVVGLFNPLVRESLEMLYQNTHPYLFDSSKFAGRYFAPTPYAEGIRATVAALRAAATR